MGRLALFVVGAFLQAQALPTEWGPQAHRTQGEALHGYGAHSWGRQVDLLYGDRTPLPWLSAPVSRLPALWEKYALFDLLRENSPDELTRYATSEEPSYRSALARFYAAKYAFLRRQYEETVQHLAGLKPQDFPQAIRQEMQFMQGYAAYATGDRGRALTYLRPLTEKVGPFHDASNYYVGLIYYERGDWRGAALHFEAVQTRMPYAQEAPLWLAYSLAKIPDLPRLAQWGERWLSQSPTPAHADTLWPFLVVTFAQAGQCDQAETYAEKAPENRLALFWRGLCAYRQGKDTLALLRWEPLLSGKDSLALWGIYGSAQALRRLGRSEEALALLRSALPTSTPPGPEVLWLTAQLAWELRLVESAREALYAYLRFSPPPDRKQEALRWIAECFAVEGKYLPALQTLDTLPTPAPSISEARQRFYLLAGFQALGQKEFARAESLFTRAAAVEAPHTVAALFWRAEALYRQNQSEQAISAYEKFLKHPQASKSPYESTARIALAWTFLQLSRADDALRYSEPLRKKASGEIKAQALFVSAGAFYLKKRYEEARNLYQELLSTMPTPEVRYYLAQTLIRLERYKEAESVLAEVIPTAPGADRALYLRAELCGVWLNRPECTKEAAEQLLRYFPSSSWAGLARARLGLALAELNEREEAIRTLRKVLEDHAPASEACRLALEGLRTLLPPSAYDSLYQAFLQRLPPESDTRLALERERLRQLAEAERWPTLREEALRLRLRYPSFAGEALLWEAQAAENLRDTTRALSLYEELTRYPDYALKAWEHLSRLHAAQGRTDRAWACQDSLLRRLPPSGFLRIQGLLAWADLAATLQKADTALRILSPLLEDTLLNPLLRQRVFLAYASLLEQKSLIDSALFYLQNIPRLEKNLLAAEALYHMSRLYYAQQRYAEARAAIYRLRDELPAYLEPRAKAYLILARIFLAENKRKSARQLLESLIENAPTEAIRAEARLLKDSIPPDPPPAPSKPSGKKKK